MDLGSGNFHFLPRRRKQIFLAKISDMHRSKNVTEDQARSEISRAELEYSTK
jgi:hypothetical protein